jgi:hypothetical protein
VTVRWIVEEVAMSETIVPDLVEAVIISGPRRGQIIALNSDLEETWTDEEVHQLSRALRELDSALIGLLDETRGLKQDLHDLRGVE